MTATKKTVKKHHDPETFFGLGRRKSSVAKVKMVAGSGKILINGKTPEKYFPNKLIIQDMELPLVISKLRDKYDVHVKVSGGGYSGQAGAIRLGITRVLISANEDLKPELKANKLVTRDKRHKERKKVGKYGARRSPQFVKR